MSSASAEIVSPVPADADGLANVLSFIEAHEVRHGTSPDPAFFLSGAGEHDRVELTEQLYEVLKRVAHALSHGQSISILTRDQEISTQQAAEILGLSRPTVVRLIQDGELDAHVPGAVRRKLRLADPPHPRQTCLPNADGTSCTQCCVQAQQVVLTAYKRSVAQERHPKRCVCHLVITRE